MNAAEERRTAGRIASLHLHPSAPGGPMRRVPSFELVTGMGIQGNDRYFGRRNRATGQSSIRQVSLMEREQIHDHARTLGLHEIPPGGVRANIETVGINLVALLGKYIQLGDAILLLCEARTPCAKMDKLCQGLRALMEDQRQGVLAQVMHSGVVSEGDAIHVLENAPEITAY